MTVSINSEIPDELHDAMQKFLEDRKNWDQDRVTEAALSLFLMQTGIKSGAVNEIYLDNLFGTENR